MGEVEVPSSAGQFEIDIAATLFTTSGDPCSLNDVRLFHASFFLRMHILYSIKEP